MEALVLLCETLAQESFLRDVLEREGFTIPTGSGEGSKAHPAPRLLAETRTQASNLLASFGLTPRGRWQLKIQAPVELETNPFAAIMNRSKKGKPTFSRIRPYDLSLL